MKQKLLVATLCALSFASCSKQEFSLSEPPAGNTTLPKEVTENAQKIFGTIDASQDWNTTTSGTITVTADAKLDNVSKVQILTESPFLNEDAKVLAWVKASKGQTVTISYEAPSVYTQLVAACVDREGHYFTQVFNVGDTKVSFQTDQPSASRRASASEVPSFTTLKLRAPHYSFNAMRAQQGASCIINKKTYTEWANSNWNDQMWEVADGQTFDGGWKLDSESNRGHIYRDLNGFAEGEKENLEKILNSFFFKYADAAKKIRKNNAAIIRNSTYVKTNNSYVYSDGVNPITLIPVQIYTEEFKMNHIYYYYYKETDIPAGMSEVDYIKSLPKFKAIQVERTTTTTDSKVGPLFRNKEFLLPYFEEAPVQGNNKASAIFPKGYKIGFLNMKHTNGNYDITNVKHGCTYGDGRLNYEVNHIEDHFKSAMDIELGGKYEDGMQWTDSRIATFTANGKTYMCFEEGADCNFSDMVIEIGGGVDKLEETPEVEAEAYTMCFEDRPHTADYDLNDVVLRCTRVNKTTLSLALVAAGGNDDVYIHGAKGWELNDREVHDIFMAQEPDSRGNRFVNTEKGGTHREVQARYVTVAEGVTIPEYLKGITIENKATGVIIGMAQKGQPPYAVIVPEDFQYPMEKTSITGAYKQFIEWAQDVNASADWYRYEEADKIFPSLFKKW